MTYPLLALCVLVVAFGTDAFLKTFIVRESRTWLTIAALVALTFAFDWLLVHIPIVIYTPSMLSHISLAGIPIEDFSYPVAAAIITLSVRARYERHHERAA